MNMSSPSKTHGTIVSLSWWTRRRSLLQALVLYVNTLIPGTFLVILLGVLLSRWLSETQSFYIGPLFNFFFAVGLTLLISQHKSRRTRLLSAILCAMVALMDMGAIITLLVPALVSMLPNEHTFEQ